MLEVIQHLQSEGYPVKELIPDGKIYRHQKDKSDTKKNLWSMSFQNHTRNGETFYVAVYGDWSDSSQPKVFHTLKGRVSSEDKKFIKKQVDQAVKKGEEDRLKIQEEISKEVTEKFNSLSTTGTSDYLSRKKLSNVPNLGIRYDNFTGDIYVDARDSTGKIWTLQRITRDGTKLFTRGGRISSCFHVIGTPEADGRIYIAEGFATAASIYLATNVGTICAFNSGNLRKVHSEIRQMYPNAELITCGDDDIWSKRPDGTLYNAGRVAAEEIGDSVFPKFKTLIEKETTDFNDLHCIEGIDAVKKQLTEFKSIRKQMAVYALGYDDTGFYFTSTNHKYISCFSSPGESDLIKLAPLEYWETLFPGGNSTRVNWAEARSTMIRYAQAKGTFRHSDVRGAGVWLDKDRVVINMGDHLIVDNEKVELGEIKSRYFYTPGKFLGESTHTPATIKEANILIEACNGFKWSKPESSQLLAGALVLSKVCGAIPVRPHVWITGAAKTGKTSLMEYVVNKIIGNFGLYAQGNTSEAGIRQMLKNNAIPVMLDEFETDGKKTDERVVAIIELMRAAWSDSTASLIKGSAGGRATTFNARFSAIVSSIRCNLTNDADISRFAVLELIPHESDAETWANLKNIMEQIDEEYANKIFARTIKMLPILLENFSLLRLELAKKGGARFGDHYGMLMAGYSILLTDKPITEDDAQFLVHEVNLGDQLEESKSADHDECLEKILTTQVTYDTLRGPRKALIGELISTCIKGIDTDADKALQLLGINVRSSDVAIAGKNHATLQSTVFKDTKWSGIWGASLARISGAEKSVNVRLNGKDKRCVTIPHKMFL